MEGRDKESITHPPCFSLSLIDKLQEVLEIAGLKDHRLPSSSGLAFLRDKPAWKVVPEPLE